MVTLDLAYGCSTSVTQIWAAAAVAMSGRDHCFIAEGPGGLVDYVVVEGRIGELCIAAWSPFLGRVREEREWGEARIGVSSFLGVLPFFFFSREKEENGEEHVGEEASHFDFRSAHVVGDSASPQFGRAWFGFLSFQCSLSPARWCLEVKRLQRNLRI
ncbi:hypothetical protein NL676_023781 [Syzygium grande]|nr:hypothetical protein NL676_023781 [Syzygium grande]